GLGPDQIHKRRRGPHGYVAGLELRHRALARGHRDAVAPHPRRPPDEQARGLDLRGDIGEHLLDALLLQQRPAVGRGAAVEVVERPLVSRARDADRARAHERARDLERGQRAGGAAALPAAGALQLALELVEAAEQVIHGHAHVLEHDLGGLRGADAELVFLLAHGQAGRALLDHERGLAAVAERRVDGRDDDVDVGDAAVGDEDLGAVQDPLVALAPRGGAQRLDVRAGAGLGDRVGAEPDLVAEAEDRGDPAGDLLGRARGGDPGRGQRRRLDGQGDAGAAPVQLLRVDDRAQALAVGGHALDVVEAVQAPGARLADDLPRHLLRAVVVGGGRADDLLGEPVAVPLVREGLVAEAEVHHPSLTYGGVQQTRHGYARPGCPAVPSPRSSLPALPSSSPW